MAILANELRKGNWLQAPLGEYMQVEIIGHSDVPDYIFARGKECFGQNGFEPIPLTPEILESCGLKKHGGYNYEFDEPEHFQNIILKECWLDGSNNEWYIVFEQKKQRFYMKAKYLHQVQNSVHVLTGKELEVQL